MPRARYTSPYFGDGMNNLAQALYGDPTADVQAGLAGDRRKLTQAQERKAIAEAVLEELNHTRQLRDDELATGASGAFPHMDPNMAELAARGGGTFNQRASGINTLAGANAAQGGDHYLSLALQGKMPGPDYAPSASRADEVSGRNANEAYRQATDVAGIGANSRVLSTLLQEEGKDRRPNAGRAPKSVSPTDVKHLRDQLGSQLTRRLEARGINAEESEVAEMVDQLVDFATSNYQNTSDAGAAVDMALEAAFSGGHIGQTEPNFSIFGKGFGGGDPYLKESWGEHKQQAMGRPTAPGAQPNPNAGLRNQLLQSLGLDPSIIGGEEEEDVSPVVAALIPDAETPSAEAPGVTPLAEAMGAGVGAFDPAPAEEFSANPANRNMSHPGAEPQMPAVRSYDDINNALQAAGEAVQQGADPAIILSKLELMGVKGEPLTKFKEALAKAGLLEQQR